MSVQDEEFLKRLRATFKVEAQEHLQAIATGLLQLETGQPVAQQQVVVETIYREAHSLKGAARAVNLSGIEAICQAVETVFAAWKRKPIDLSAEMFDALHRAVDAMRSVLALSESGERSIDETRHLEVIQRLGQLQSRSPSTGGAHFAGTETNRLASLTTQPSPVIPAVESTTRAMPETVRISTAKLDARLLQAEEMLALKLAAEQRIADVRNLIMLLEQRRKAWAKVSTAARPVGRARELGDRSNGGQPPADPAMLLEFLDSYGDHMRMLEDKLKALAVRAEQDRQNVAKLVDDLLEDSKKLLMLPFSTLAEPFPKLVRDLARDQGKEAELVVRGGEVEIDKRVLEVMKDPLVHILRNCIDHGVEQPS